MSLCAFCKHGGVLTKKGGHFYGKKMFSFNTVKEVSCRAVITACQIAPAREIIWIFFPPSQSAAKQKAPLWSNLPW